LKRLLPPPGLPRSLAFQSAIIATGGGVFLTGSVVYFTAVKHLSAAQIGIGLSAAGLVNLAFSLPIGVVADRLGGKTAWVLGAILEALSFVAFPFVAGFLGFVALMAFSSAADVLAQGGRTIYTADAIPPGDRVRVMAFSRAYLNVGFTLGAGIGAMALAIHSSAALNVVILANAAGLLANAAIVARFPAVHREHHPATVTIGSRLAVLKDRPFLGVSVLFAVIWFHSTIFTEIIPLWAVTKTDAPKPVLGALFALNTVMAVALQVPATRGAVNLSACARLLRWGALATAAGCPLILLTKDTSGWTTVGLLAAAVTLTTVTELWSSAVQWYVQTEVPPADQRGAYVGASRSIGAAGRMVAPAGLTFLAISTGGWGWWLVAAMFLGAAALAGPAFERLSRRPERPHDAVDLALAES
jgi:MFS family permease